MLLFLCTVGSNPLSPVLPTHEDPPISLSFPPSLSIILSLRHLLHFSVPCMFLHLWSFLSIIYQFLFLFSPPPTCPFLTPSSIFLTLLPSTPPFLSPLISVFRHQRLISIVLSARYLSSPFYQRLWSSSFVPSILHPHPLLLSICVAHTHPLLPTNSSPSPLFFYIWQEHVSIKMRQRWKGQMAFTSRVRSAWSSLTTDLNPRFPAL